MDLPRNLYKSPGNIIFNATKSYSTIVVNNMEEHKAGIEAGYIDSFSDALNGVITGEFEVIEDTLKGSASLSDNASWLEEPVDEEAAKKAASLAKRRATIARKKAKAEAEAKTEEVEESEKDDFDDF